MTKEEVQHLATLARIELTEAEADTFRGEFDAILGYVDVLKEIAGAGEKKEVGAMHNVFREDSDPHEPGIYTEDLLNAAPERDGAYVKVKKILGEG